MKKILIFLFVLASAVALATGANALTAGTIPSGGTNEFIGPLFPGPDIGGFYGAQLFLISGGPISITLDYYGAEASWNNEFNFDGLQVFAHLGGNTITGSVLATSVVSADPGLLPFTFDVNSDAGSVANGSNPDDSGGAVMGPNFFVTFDPYSSASGPTSGQSVWVFLDDGGAGPDDNHDDMLVRLSITGGNFSVPEPATLILLGLGLVGLASLRRK